MRKSDVLYRAKEVLGGMHWSNAIPEKLTPN